MYDDEETNRILLHKKANFNHLFRFQNLFTESDVLTTIDSKSFNQGLGLDGFSGKSLLHNSKVKDSLAMWMTEVLNASKKIPGYFCIQRFLPFSKSSSPEVEIDKIRGIAINSHLTNIFENTILNKLN